MVTEIDGLNIRLGADFSDLDRALKGLDRSMLDVGTNIDANLGQAFDNVSQRMSSALERFAQRGELSFSSLKTAGLSAASGILSSFLDLGLQQIGFGSGGQFGGGSLVSNLIGGLFGRASGGPVSAGVPYMVGERGPELFTPRQPGRVAANGRGGGGGSNITVNVYGANDDAQIRQSASQVAAAVAATLKRGQRNL